MTIQPGTILISTTDMSDSIFEKAVLFIAEYNDKGALGFVINKLFPRLLNELEEFKHSLPLPLYDGGPVEQEGIFFLHQRPELVDAGNHLAAGIYIGGNFKQAIAHYNKGTITEKDIKLFIGYCGWDPQQLEEEIAEGSWLITAAGIETVFTSANEMLWQQLHDEASR